MRQRTRRGVRTRPLLLMAAVACLGAAFSRVHAAGAAGAADAHGAGSPPAWMQKLDTAPSPPPTSRVLPKVPLPAVAHLGASTPFRDRVLASIVGIERARGRAGSSRPEPGRSASFPAPRVGTGTGVLVDAEGSVLTCAHVVEDATMVRVFLQGEREVAGRVKVLDRASDMAIVTIEPTGLPALDLQAQPALVQGERVYLASRPRGAAPRFEAGQLAATGTYHLGHSQLEFLRRFMGSIEPGDSGGALLDAEGRFLGLVSVGHPQGALGYAIAREFVLVALARLRAGGPVVWPWLGIGVETPPASPGILVWTVAPGSPADAAGVRVGDRIVELDDRPVEHFLPTMLAVVSRPIGARFRLRVETVREMANVEAQGAHPPGDGNPPRPAVRSVRTETHTLVSVPRPIEPLLPALDLFERLTGIRLAFEPAANGEPEGLRVLAFTAGEAHESRPYAVGSRLVAIVPGSGLVHGLEEGRPDQEMKIVTVADLEAALRASFDGPRVAAALIWTTHGTMQTMLLSGEAKQYPLL